MNAGYVFTLITEDEVLNNKLNTDDYDAVIFSGFDYKGQISEAAVTNIKQFPQNRFKSRALIVDVPVLKDPAYFFSRY